MLNHAVTWPSTLQVTNDTAWLFHCQTL